MVKDTIKIFARVKPTKSKIGLYGVDDEEGTPGISFTVPRDIGEGFINNKKEVYKFKFERVFDKQAKQDEIFDHVAQPVIDNVLSGYNGTIFAYGQTGSGKTFTITGGAERYIDRGIIPRTLSYIFQSFSKSPGHEYTTHITYLEIYNEYGYDLLDPKHEASKLEDLPKVVMMEDDNQNIHLKNLSTHRAANEEEALNLLFLGDTNRMIAETPMNQASTRSHCIFTIHISSRESGSATIRRAKLHLVDLAGSERVSKTGVNGVLLTEAKYINLSLHFLEQVIVSLAEKNRTHIPYRNSMMTSVLRDSLGGNCMTTMIATVSVEKKNLDESISTCRFAQRVALIKNDAVLNEELDPKLMIQRLKREVAQLKEELAMATGEQRTDDLSEEDLERCQEAINQFLQNSDMDATINLGADMRKIQHSFKLIKKAYLDRRPSSGGGHSSRSELSEATPRPGQPSHYDDAESAKLKGLLIQRDNEINILVNMLKKEKKRAADAQAGRAVTPRHNAPRNNAPRSVSSNAVSDMNRPAKHGDRPNSQGVVSQNVANGSQNVANGSHNGALRRNSSSQSISEEPLKRQVLGELSMGRQEAFETYRRDYPGQRTIEENKLSLKQRYAQAKALGERVNGARTNINKLKSSIEQHRMSRVMEGLVDPDNPEADEMEMNMKEQLEQQKQNYKGSFNELRTLKTEIEHLQHLLEKSKVKLMKDFEIWWAEQAAKVQEQQDLLKSLPRASNSKSAWNTPPVTPVIHHNNAPIPSISAESSQTSLLSEPSSQSRPIGHSSHLAPLNARHSDTSGYSSNMSSASQSRSSRGLEPAPGGIPLTGDAQADADIMAFVKARQTVANHMQAKR